MELTGTWRARAADEDLRRSFASPDFDDREWDAVEVPGHWRSSDAFARADGPLLYRRPFDAPAPGPSERAWLVLDGLFYQGDVWLDGGYVGDTEGYFFPHAFEVTDDLRERGEHVLAVEVTCAPQRDRTAKRNLTGVFQHWDALDPEFNPGGIWRPVRVERTGPVRIASLRVLCTEADEERAVLSFRALLDAATGGPALVRSLVGGIDHERQQTLAAGENRLEWTVTIERPDLWWPHALGAQHLHDVVVEVWAGPPGEREGPSDRRALRTGLRQVRMTRWVLHVNGERLFVKGSNQGPTRMALADATADDCRRDVRLAVDAGLDLLRVHAHVARPELYAAADEAGLLLWQDMPLQWGYARGVRKQAARQARAAVDLLGHHPSIAVWCGHNEPLAIDVEPGVLEDPAAKRRVAVRAAVGMELPSWNKTVLDHSIKRALEKGDPSRPVVPHSGVLPHPGSGGTDTHVYFGWYHGDERAFPRLMAAFPRLARFVSEFGAQAVPDADEFMEPHRWPDLDWDRLTRRHCLQKALFDRYAPPAEHGTFDSWRKATQDYQATVVRHHVEYLRRIKYRPTGGFCHFSFADAFPSVTWSVLDHERRPKTGYAALAEACQPVIVTADRPAASYCPGAAVALDVHVVNDLRRPLPGAVVTARLAWDGGEATWRWEGDVPADECARVGIVQAVVPDATGPLTLDLTLDHADARATNRYESRISREREADGRMTP